MVAAGPRRPSHGGWRRRIRPGPDRPATPRERNGTTPLPPPKQWAVITKVLIANRGEIAVRVIRACQELGITSVAVYSDLDRDSLHVRLADEAYALGGTTAAESYLNTDKILEIIESSGADAVHPGYGFFSENTDFARAITARGVAFIGPPPEAIEVMGDKVSSRIAAQEAGVQGVPGTTQFLESYTEIVDFGTEHGWPVAIKAAYGGGGHGMRVVNSADEAESALESAQSEALKGFGRDECYVERYLTWPRHIEMQIIGDTHGDVVWVAERDCSAQRRHQKLIEEARPRHSPPRSARAMGEAARDGRPGLRVRQRRHRRVPLRGRRLLLPRDEHPAPGRAPGHRAGHRRRPRGRAASGRRGEPLSFTQDDIDLHGHSIEVRINAEDVAGGRFLPSPGPITKLRPADGFGVRWDGGTSRRRDQPVLRQPRRQALRVGQGPRRRRSPA